MKGITIVGAGLAGTLLAIYLARRGYGVKLFESRPDIRKGISDRGRSINLALSCRGITGLQGAQLMASVTKMMVPMRARAIHDLDGTVKFQAFGRHQDEYINAIHRSELNALLLDAAEEESQIQVVFDQKLIGVDIYRKTLSIEDSEGAMRIEPYDILIGADGAPSLVREALTRANIIQSSRKFLPHGYKELTISCGRFSSFTPEHLHLWPRDFFMLLGNPNRDNSITGTLFLPNTGPNSFESLSNEINVNSFFKQQFPDAYPAMPDLMGEFFSHPTGHLSTVTCSPWYFEDSCLLIGDAAHGIVPFFGQGMNSAFEDCRLLNELLEFHEDEWDKVMPAFFAERKPNTDAVAQMSMENYHEIQTDIREEKFNFKKQLEQELMHRYSNYVSKHVLVMFTNTPYAKAFLIGELQKELLQNIVADVDHFNEINWRKVDKLMQEYDKNLAGAGLI